MTVSNQTARTSATGTNTAGQEIAYSFPANVNTDLIVMTRVTATGVEATLTFVPGEDGRANEVVLHQAGQELRGKRVD